MSSSPTMSDMPYDIQLTIVNNLSVKDAKNFGKYIQNEKGVEKYLLAQEYISHYLNNKLIHNLCNAVIFNTINMVCRTIKSFRNSDFKPLRLNTDNGILYTRYPESMKNSFFVSNITLPELPHKNLSLSFQTIGRGRNIVYYDVVDVLLVVIDDVNEKLRNILVRIPYNCEDYVFGFAANSVQLISNILKETPQFKDWGVSCEYMLYSLNWSNSCVCPISSKYNTRNIDVFYHQFMEKLLYVSLENNGYKFRIRPWDVQTSMFKNDTARMKNPLYINRSYNVENILHDIGFPKNEDIKSDVYINPQTSIYYEIRLEDQEEIGEN